MKKVCRVKTDKEAGKVRDRERGGRDKTWINLRALHVLVISTWFDNTLMTESEGEWCTYYMW